MTNERLRVADTAETHRYAKELIRANDRAFLGTVLLHTAAVGAGLGAPLLLGWLVEDIRDGVAEPGLIIACVLALLLAQGALTLAALNSSAQLGEKVLTRLREDFVANMLRLPTALFERAGTGELLTRSSHDVSTLANVVRRAAPQIFIAVVTCLLTLGALVVLNPILAVPGLLGIPLLWYSSRWYLCRAREGYLRERSSYAGVVDGLTESIQGARTVEALALAALRVARTESDIERSWGAELYTLRLRTIWFPSAGLAWVLPLTATLALSGYLYAEGELPLAHVVAAALYVHQLADPLDRFVTWMNELQAGQAALSRVRGVAQPPRPPADPLQSLDVTSPRDGRLVIDQVSFSYREGVDTLREVSLVVEAGERIALVGASGAGKTTLGRLVAGAYEPAKGSILLDGRPLTLTSEQDDLLPGLASEQDALPSGSASGRDDRRRVALVAQEHHVFSGTLRDNLTAADPRASDAELRRALDVVKATSWVARLPQGLDTILGADAFAVSPAQAQQLALARIVVADPQVIVLDEATSFLDPQLARDLESAMTEVLSRRTIIYIAHRLHTARDADRIAVMEEGRIVELGTHDDLLSRDGAYARLWRAWCLPATTSGEGQGANRTRSGGCAGATRPSNGTGIRRDAQSPLHK
ncbi:ABC transporter ATP-binding protein [Nonomuraea sp. NPDC050328]|uniref:ABC transporter ATP-binding protein n=1 Tax=Nonomuraea sp. NPDC050328 TaxID=3364361 RepID=UPI0037B860F0